MLRERETLSWARKVFGEVRKRRFFAGDILRLLGFPVQKLFDRTGGTHRFLTLGALETLEADGFLALAAWYRGYLGEIMRGNRWADGAWKNSCHHYNPRRGRGLLLWPSAVDQAKTWFRRSVHSWESGDALRSMFFLGACLHIIQDVCQPYHSNCVILDGHQKYERWVDRTKELYPAEPGGIYDLGPSVEDWVKKNAEFSHEFLPLVQTGSYGDGYHSATAVLLGRARRTSAGFFVFFMETVGKSTSHEPARGFFEEVLRWENPDSRSGGSSRR